MCWSASLTDICGKICESVKYFAGFGLIAVALDQISCFADILTGRFVKGEKDFVGKDF